MAIAPSGPLFLFNPFDLEGQSVGREIAVEDPGVKVYGVHEIYRTNLIPFYIYPKSWRNPASLMSKGVHHKRYLGAEGQIGRSL